MATDEQLIRQIQQGENEAFSQLFCKYQKHIHSICLSILKNPQDAEEVASDTFVHAYLKLDQLKNPEKFFAWLKKIAQNRSRDFLRSKREETIPFVYAMKQPSRQIAPDELLLKQELVNSIMEAIELLPQKDREVIQAHIDGLSHAEISEKLGISYQASRSRLSRARKKITEYTKDLLNAVIGLPKMLPFKKIISGGILAMKIGTSTKVTIGVIGVLVAGFIGFQVVIHHKTQQIEVKPPGRVTQQQMARPTSQPKSVSQCSDDDEQDVGQLEKALAWFDSLEEEYSTEFEENEVTDSPLPNPEEDEITVKIQELKAQLAKHWQQVQVIEEERREIRELMHAGGWERHLESKARMDAVYRQMELLGKNDEAERKVLQERIKQIMDEHNSERAPLYKRYNETAAEADVIVRQIIAIRNEIAYLKGLRLGEASSDGR